MYSDQQKKKNVRGAWMGVAVGVLIAVGAGYYLYQRGPEYVPPPVNANQTIELELGAGCELRVAMPGEEIDVYQRPLPNDLIIDSIPHDTALEFDSVRVNWVEVTSPVEGWVERRYVAEVCP